MVLVSFEIKVVSAEYCQIGCNSNGNVLFHLDILFQECKIPDSKITKEDPKDIKLLFGHRWNSTVVDNITTLVGNGTFVKEKLLTKEAIENKTKFSIEICELPQEVLYALGHNWKLVPEESIEKRPIWNKLRPFQKHTVQKALNKNCHGRLMLCDEMGLGKSIQTLACVDHVQDGWPALVVCPSTNKENWVSETCDHMEFSRNNILVGKSSKVLVSSNLEKYKMIIVSYQLVDKLVEILDKDECKFWPRSIIVDESHNIKNFKAKKTQCLLKLIPRIEYRFLLSGTPMTRSREYFGQLNSLHPKLFPYFTQYAERYCIPVVSYIGFKRPGQAFKRQKIVNYDKSTRLVELHAILQRTFMMRRTKKEVLADLPPKHRIRFVLNPLNKSKIKIEKDEKEETFLKLLHKGVAVKADNIIKNFLQDREPPEKEIWFFNHMEMKTKMATWLLEQNISHLIADGQGTWYHSGKKDTLYEKVDRQDIMIIFQKCARPCQIALLSFCFNSGLTLVVSSSILFLELYSNAITLLQAEDRIHRIGQTADKVTITYLVQANSIDEILWPLISKKYENLTSVLDGKSEKLTSIL